MRDWLSTLLRRLRQAFETFDARTLLPALGTLWAGYVWLGALEVVQGLTRRLALVLVGLVVLTQLPAGDPSIVIRS